MHIINSRSDIRTYAANYLDGYSQPDGMTAAQLDAVTSALLAADHPEFGADWSEWLDANAEAVTMRVLGTATVAEVVERRTLSRERANAIVAEECAPLAGRVEPPVVNDAGDLSDGTHWEPAQLNSEGALRAQCRKWVDAYASEAPARSYAWTVATAIDSARAYGGPSCGTLDEALAAARDYDVRIELSHPDSGERRGWVRPDGKYALT